MIFAVFACLGFLLAVLRAKNGGGRLKADGILQVKGLWALAAAFLLHSLPKLIPGMSVPFVDLATVAWDFLVLLFLFDNRTIRIPVWLMTAGTILNFCVIAANGFRMPVSPAALAMYPGMTPEAVAAKKVGYFIAVNGAALYPLGDVIPVPFGRLSGFASVGDFLLGIGFMLFLPSVLVVPGGPEKKNTEAL